MWKLYEFFKILQFEKIIFAAATIWGNTVFADKEEGVALSWGQQTI